MERVRHAIAQISRSISVDAFEFPNGEIRVGVTSAAVLLGYSKEYLSRLAKRGKKKLKALQQEGYAGWQKPGEVIHEETRGASRVTTISVQDLSIWINYEAKHGNKTAFDLSSALIEETLEERLGHAFNRKQKTVEEKIEFFQERLDRVCRETAESFTDEEWKQTSGAGGGSSLLPSAWERRMLSTEWQPQVFLQFRSDDEIEEFLEAKLKEIWDECFSPEASVSKMGFKGLQRG